VSNPGREILNAAMTEEQLLQAVVDLARARRYLIYHTLDSRGSAGGFPDVVAAKSGRLVFLELKAAKGTVSPVQQKWIDVLNSIPGVVYAGVFRPVDWPLIDRLLA